MMEGKITVGSRELPRTLLGTSPFIGAAQFGHRARLYQLDLYRHPENMLKIIRAGFEMGVVGMQLLPYPPVVEALKMAQDEGMNLQIIGTIRPDQEEEDIHLLSDLEADAMMLHAVATDQYNYDFLEKQLENISDTGSIAGLVTHMPFRTTTKLLESPIKDLFQLYMLPVNQLGYLMDCERNLKEEREHLRQLVLELDKIVIAKKVMAAGIMTPPDAFEYLKGLDYVDMVAVGIASVEEARETFHILQEK